MTGSNFDKDITELYQQRKAKVIAPSIVFPKDSLFTKYHPAKLLSLVVAGGLASFGVMAIISHLARPNNNVTTVTTLPQQVELIKIAPAKPDENPAVAVKPLPPKPYSKAPNIQQEIQTQVMTIDENPVPNSVNLNSLVSVVVLPELSQPEMAIEPTHKVLPEYSLSARQANQTGEITLSYHIDTTGNIENITIVATNVSRTLQRSAKKALAQWRYPPNKQLSGQHQVVFKFALAEQ